MSELSQSEKAAFSAAGAIEDQYSADMAAVRSAAETARIQLTALTVRQAAQACSTTVDRILHMAEKTRELCSFVGEAGELHLPAFQFLLTRSGTGLLPGIQSVMPHARPTADPIELCRFFELAHCDLEHPVSGESLSPRAWLASGYSPAAIVPLIAEI